MLADDLGWTDVSLHGGNLATPNIDSIAVLGTELARYYVAPVCSPTRTGLLTGRYPIRFGSMRAVYPPWKQGGMDLSKTTLPEMLAAAGYKHRGILGKMASWAFAQEVSPAKQGFYGVSWAL